MEAERLAEEPLHAVADDGAADRPPDGEPQARLRPSVGPRVDDEEVVPAPPPLAEGGVELRALADPEGGREAPGLHRGSVTDGEGKDRARAVAGGETPRMVRLLHRRGRVGTAEGRLWAERLAGALGVPVEPRAAEPGESGEWRLLSGAGALAAILGSREQAVVLPRRDPRWSLEDMVKRPLDGLPPGCRIVAPPGLGEALLLRARPDVIPLKAGGFPAPEETPVLAEGPYDGRPAGDPLDAAAFLPAPGTGQALLLPPAGVEAPAAVRALEDAAARACLEIEAAFADGVGDLPAGAALGTLARKKVEVLYGVRAVLFTPGRPPRDFAAEVPLADRLQFARAFGRHLRDS